MVYEETTKVRRNTGFSRILPKATLGCSFLCYITNDHRHGQAEYDEVKVEESAVPKMGRE